MTKSFWFYTAGFFVGCIFSGLFPVIGWWNLAIAGGGGFLVGMIESELRSRS